MITFTGKDICAGESPTIRDIAVSLGRQCRYNGACADYWPVLTHSLAVADIVAPELEVFALLHDAAETIISDIPTTVKTMEYELIEADYLRKIYTSFGVPWPTEEQKQAIKTADRDILYAECQLIGPPGIGKYATGRPTPEAVKAVYSYLKDMTLESVISPEGGYVWLYIARLTRCLKEGTECREQYLS